MKLIAALYLLIVNIIGFAIMGIDKSKARKHAWRIPERTFFLVTLLGGGIGSLIGMYFFHHKTRHWYFVVGIPAILIGEILLLCILRFHFGWLGCLLPF